MPTLILINQILSVLKGLSNNRVNNFLISQDEGAHTLMVNNEPLVRVDHNSILLLGADITSKIFLADSPSISDSIDINNIKRFFRAIQDHLVGINHLGINYSCPNIEDELAGIKALIKGKDLQIYEEISSFPHQRWFFVANLDSDDPMFEMVLTESAAPVCDKWTPHFQIDLDTDLSLEEIKELTGRYLKPNFLDWQMDVPDMGVVLIMGELSNINGTKIFLGLGTDKRNSTSKRSDRLILI